MARFLADYWPEALAVCLIAALAVSSTIRRFAKGVQRWYLVHVPTRVGVYVAIASAIATVTLPSVYNSPKNPIRIHVIAALVITQALAVGLPLMIQTSLQQAISQAHSTAIGNVTRTLVPLTGLVRILSELRGNAKEKRRYQGMGHQAALTAASLLLGRSNDVRASWFATEGVSPSRQLVPPGVASSVGRADMATTTFREDTILGRSIFDALASGQPVRCSDIRVDPPAGWVSHPTVWRSFISVPVVHAGVLLGMLTADSPEPGDFDALDDAMALTLAHLFATVLKS